ncbi:uncharacterized protein YxjI [Thermosporothrix hazakensis]|jgi:uncharacterized protein YxjI|uniref:Uncharacterized protein YxjI n=2 Tax=Thermosporothrix TaxID=768650 RepID=A0A326U8B0_THEHA|nr:LURP-one-related family protein [Thermosporothrix hazakensis]PZW29425.1 uncharacterized protein YxjI [Thermosporothrix hazakensis]BBH85711.1 hypothetical protein KTC_04620 [Thermosporothrix sp. COM3]GCE45860.1 hypothetical protein KTH_07290 [Thermosporothrix hazakensis]
MRYHVKEWIFPLGDNFTVRGDNGEVLYEVKARLISIGDHFTMYDKQTGEEVMRVKQRVLADTRQYELFKGDAEVATIHRKHEATHGARFEIVTRDSVVLQVRGNFKEWDFEIVDQYGRVLGHVSREFAIFGDSYTVDTAPEIDGPFIVAIAIILDEMKEDRIKD